MNVQMFKKKLICGYTGKSGIIHQKHSISTFWSNCQHLLLRIELGLLHIDFFFFFSLTCPSSVQIFCTCFLFPEGNDQWKSNHVANFKDQKGKIHEPQLLQLQDTWSTWKKWWWWFEKTSMTLKTNFKNSFLMFSKTKVCLKTWNVPICITSF